MPAGRPLIYDSPEEMQESIDLYFKECRVEEKHPTVTGLALALGFTNRQSLINYAERDKFFDTVNKAKGRIEEYLEQRLYSNSVAGVIFNLKNNYQWKDKTETELSTKDDKPIVLWGVKSE